MVHFHIGADRCGANEVSAMKSIAKELRKCGHKVDIGTVTPEQEAASYRVSKKHVFLYLVCGVAPATIWSFKVAVAKGASPPTIFLHSGWTSTNPNSPMHSEKQMLNQRFIPEHDSGGFANPGAMKRDAGSATTVGAYAKKYSKYIGVAWAKTPKEMGQKLCNGDVTGYGTHIGSGGKNRSSGNSGGSSSGGSNSSTGQSSTGSSGTSPLINGEQTFEELIGDICKSIDLIFAVKRSTVVVSDYESIYAQAKYIRDKKPSVVQAEDIKMWQVQDGSYELDVNQYGYYNTVRVHYKNGVVTEDYEDLVTVFGTVAIDYYEPKIDKTTAEMKAKAYLAAHVRDFDMSIRATILHDGDIEIGDIITIENPMTMRDENRENDKRDPEYYFVKGTSISWEGNSFITNDLDLRYGAESPEGKEIPEAGTTYKKTKNTALKDVKGYSESDQKYIKKIVAQALTKANNPKSKLQQAKAIFEYYRINHVYSGYNDMPKTAHGFKYTWEHKDHNCGDGAATLKAMFLCAGFTNVQIVNGHNHYWIKIKIDGEYYYCDQSGAEGRHNWRHLGKNYNNNTVWQG